MYKPCAVHGSNQVSCLLFFPSYLSFSLTLLIFHSCSATCLSALLFFLLSSFFQVGHICCRFEFKADEVACFAFFKLECLIFHEVSSPRSWNTWMPGCAHAYGECSENPIVAFILQFVITEKTIARAGMGCSKNYSS